MKENVDYQDIHLYVKGDAELISSLIKDASYLEFQIEQPIEMRGDAGLIVVIVTLSSANVFAALINLIITLLQNNKGKELEIERRGVKVKFKDYPYNEAMEVIRRLAPELLEK